MREKKKKTAEEITKQIKQKIPPKNPKHCAEIMFPFQVTEQLMALLQERVNSFCCAPRSLSSAK